MPARHRTESPMSSSPRACRSFSGAAFLTRSCSTWPSAESSGQEPVLERQVRRMLADERSRALVDNFAEQWLYLRNLGAVTPDPKLFPDFDDNLREAFRRETRLFFESVKNEDRSVLDLLERELHVRQRAARAALRYSQCLRHAVPPGVAACRQPQGRASWSGQHSDGDLLRQPNLARSAR